MWLARITHKKKKSLHTFDDEPFFINCKNLCRYRNMSIISKFLVIQSKFCFKSNFHVIRSLHIKIYIVVRMYIKGHVETVDTKDQSNAIVY